MGRAVPSVPRFRARTILLSPVGTHPPTPRRPASRRRLFVGGRRAGPGILPHNTNNNNNYDDDDENDDKYNDEIDGAWDVSDDRHYCELFHRWIDTDISSTDRSLRSPQLQWMLGLVSNRWFETKTSSCDERRKGKQQNKCQSVGSSDFETPWEALMYVLSLPCRAAVFIRQNESLVSDTLFACLLACLLD